MVQSRAYMLKPKFPVRRLIFPVFNMLWFSYVIHLLNKPTNKLCFNLKNNTVCYYWLIIFRKNPSSPYSLHTHTLTCTAQRIYISKIYTRNRTMSLRTWLFSQFWWPWGQRGSTWISCPSGLGDQLIKYGKALCKSLS